jgi:hypothetical protein
LNRESFEMALGAVTSAKQPARARDVLKAMREAGLGPEQGVLAGLMAQCQEAGETKLAEEIGKEFGGLLM